MPVQRSTKYANKPTGSRSLNCYGTLKVLDIDVNSFREHHYLISFLDKSKGECWKKNWMLQKKKNDLVLEGRSAFKIFITFAATALQIITIKGWP